MEKMNSGPGHKIENPQTVDAVLEHMLEESIEVGSGKDAVVFKIDLSALPKEERHLLAQNGVITSKEDTDAMALKILKIYNPELGDHEFKMQKRAGEILALQDNAAKVPDTTMARHQEVGSAIKNRMQARGGHIEKEIEMVVMDYIDGQDIGTIMYDFILRQMEHEDSYIKDLTFSQKDQLVGQELDFELADTSKEETQKGAESLRAIAYDRNEEKLFKYLKKKGFTLPPIFEKLDNAIHALNRSGIYHNDLHRQNIMIDKTGEVYIIDFGRAGSEKRADGIADNMFSKRWRGLNQTEAETEQNARRLEQTQIEDLKKRLAAHPATKKRMSSFMNDVAKNGASALEKEFGRSHGDDARFEQFLTMLLFVRESGQAESTLVDEFISVLENKNLRPFEHNKVLKYKKYLKPI